MKLIAAAVVALAALLSTEGRAAVLWEYSGSVSSPEPRTTKAAACQDAMADPDVASLVENGFYIYPSSAGGMNYQCTVYNGAGEPQYHVGGLAIYCTSPHVYSSSGGPHCRLADEPDPGEPDYPPGPPPDEPGSDPYCGVGGGIILAENGEGEMYSAFCSFTANSGAENYAHCSAVGIGSWALHIATYLAPWPATNNANGATPYFVYNNCTFVIPSGKCGPVLNGQRMCFGRNTGGRFAIGALSLRDAENLHSGQGPAGRDMPLAVKNKVQHPETGMIDPGTQIAAGQRATVEVPADMLMGAYDTESIGSDLGSDTLNDHVVADWQNQTINNYYHPGDYQVEDGSLTQYYSRDWGATPFNPRKVWSNSDYAPQHDLAVLSVVNPETGQVEPYNAETHTDAVKPPAMVGIGTGGTGGGTTGGDTTTPMDIGGGPESYYERRYPDGIAGVLVTRRAQLEATPLYQLASISLPSGSGEYPTWAFEFVFFNGKVDLGTHEIEVPDWLWIMAQTFILIGAFVFAVRLIFGGA